jgi:hypothetical protein
VTLWHAGLRHKNRRTDRRITTGWPSAGPLATVRTYPLCTRDNHAPQAGHAASAALGASLQRPPTSRAIRLR